MQSAETVLGVLRERGRRGLPLEELYRQLFNPQLYLLAYGRIYSNKGAMTPGPDAETADGMTLGKIERIIDALRHERIGLGPSGDSISRQKKDGETKGRLVCRRGRSARRRSGASACWRRTTSRSSPIIPTVTGPVVVATPRCAGGGRINWDDLVYRGRHLPGRLTGLTIKVMPATLGENIDDGPVVFGWSVRCCVPGIWRTGYGTPRWSGAPQGGSLSRAC